MFKKLFIGILVGLLGFGVIYLYFLYGGNTEALRNWIGTYQLYTLIFFVSIVGVFMLQGQNKLFNFFIFIIVLINLFILGDTFFRNNIGLNSGQFITLFGLVLLALAVTYIGHRIRYILITAVCLGIAFVLLTGILPLYENIPSVSAFIQSQKAKIINQGIGGDGILTIKTALGTKGIPISKLKQSDIDLSQKTQISFASKTTSDLEKVFIDLGNGILININPQSAITLQQSGDKTTMQILQGNIEYYTPPELSGAFQLIGKYKGKNIQDIKGSIREGFVSQFEQRKKDFFINQLGGNLIFNPTVDKGISFFINTLYTISPKTYEKNLKNYTMIKQYFGVSTGAIPQEFSGENVQTMLQDLIGQIKKGAEETKINQRLK